MFVNLQQPYMYMLRFPENIQKHIVEGQNNKHTYCNNISLSNRATFCFDNSVSPSWNALRLTSAR